MPSANPPWFVRKDLDGFFGLMIDNYNRFFGYTVDRGAIAAWNEYLLENKLIPHAVKAEDAIYVGAPKP